MNFKNLIIILILFSLFSCGNQKKKDIALLLQAWSGKEILFPANLTFTVQGKDTIDFSMLGKYKILTYVDSIGCISCKLQLGKWKTFMKEVDSLEINSVRFLFFFSPEKRRDFLGKLKLEKFTYPICVDEKNRLNELNHFPVTDMNFHTFLLNQDNRILAIGNPIHNHRVKELYMNIIQGKTITKEKELTQTEIQVKESTISLGHFNWQEKQKVHFTIYNVGKRPLVINDVSTSCGCTSVDYPTQPVRPNDSISLRVIYKADNPEHFNKTITVYCNAESSPLVLKIMGDAE